MATAPGLAVCAMALLVWLVLRRQAMHPALWEVLLTAMLAAYLAAALQQKGWGYHFYPARAFALALLGLAVLDVRRPLARGVERLYAASAFAVLGTVLLLSGVRATRRLAGLDAEEAAARARLTAEVDVVRRQTPPGGSVYIMSFTNESAFPLVNYSGVRWASRFPHLWILEAAYHDRLSADPPLRYRAPTEMGPAERYLNQAVYEDLTRHRPDLLLVLRHARDLPRNTHRRLDYLAYFSRDPRIAAALRSYAPIGESGEYLLFRRAGGKGSAQPHSAPGRLDVGGPATRSARDALVHEPELLLALMSVLGLGMWRWRRERPTAQRVPSVRQGPA
jgi:hypothetical protein